MNALKLFSFGLLVVMVIGGGYALVSGSAEYRAQQDSKSIVIHISSAAATPGE
ncbi:hypothetical protein [Bdellovibrio sp. HCB209]|uniref:hypothetical protein n=1 Tax=Bdellovibrio sp. HCB209 TaxID=3394354 RepID=UPI0039B47229